MSRVKSQANSEVAYMRRAVAFRKPYDQVIKDSDIKRLKGELKDAQ